MTIKYTIAGNFNRKYFYSVNFYDEQSQEWTKAGYDVLFNPDLVYFWDHIQNKSWSLPFYVYGSTFTITGITVDDIGHRTFFYASARVVEEEAWRVYKKINTADIEPRVSSGDIMDSHRYHARIQLSESRTVELLKNGGFEDGLTSWKSFSYWPQCQMNATTSEERIHSGRQSLFTPAGMSGGGSIATVTFDPDGSISTITSGASSGYCVGGGAYQIVGLERYSDLKLSFWIYLKGVTGGGVGTDFAVVIWFWTANTPRILAYYFAWSPDLPIYRNFPAPATSSKNATNILVYGIRVDKWNYVECNLNEDFERAYPDVDLKSNRLLTVQLVAAGLKGGVSGIAAYWDDVSLTSESIPELTPSATPTTSAPTESPTATPTASPSEKIQQVPASPSPTTFTIERGIGQWLLPITLIAGLIIVVAGALVLRKRTTPKAVAPTSTQPSVTQESAPEEKVKGEFCYYCGASMPSGSQFCKKCGKSQG